MADMPPGGKFDDYELFRWLMIVKQYVEDQSAGALTISASQVTSGVFDPDRIPQLPFTRIDLAVSPRLLGRTSGGAGPAEEIQVAGGLTLAAGILSITGLPSGYVIGDLLYALSATELARLADVSVGSYLRSGGVATAPLWSTLKLPNAAAVGDLLIASATNVLAALADVSAGSYLRSGGVLTAPLWSTLKIPNAANSGDILRASGANTYASVAPEALSRTNDTNVTLTLGGTPLTSLVNAVSLTLGWTGLLALARGGTAADLSATGGAGQVLKQSSVGAAITVATLPATDIASPAALTKTDDTNVTLTLGGSPSTSLLRAVSLTLGWTSTLSLTRGGLGFDASGIAKGGLVVGTAAATVGLKAVGSDGQLLTADAASTGGVKWSSVGAATEFTTTTTGNIDDLDFSDAAIIRMNNATLATIRGLKAGVAGQRVTIVSIGAGQVDLAHQNTNSAAANRLINFVTSGVTPLAAASGASTYQYDGTTTRWRLVSHNQGNWIAVAYAAGNFTTEGGGTAWTVDAGDQTAFLFYVQDNTMSVSIAIDTSSTTGTPTQLRVTVPLGCTVNGAVYRSGFYGQGAGLNNTVALIAAAAVTFVFFNLLPLGTAVFPISVNTLQVYGDIGFPVL